MTYRRDHNHGAAAASPIKVIKTQIVDAEFDETSVESGNFRCGLSSDIDTGGDSDVFNSDCEFVSQFSAQADAVVDTDQFESTLTDFEWEADKDRQTGR